MKVFTLTPKFPLTTTIKDENDNPVYLITTPVNPLKIFRGTTTIYKYNVESSESSAQEGQEDSAIRPQHDSNTHGNYIQYQDDDPSMREIAKIQWHWMSGTRILYDFKILEVAKFMPPKSSINRTYVS